METTSARAQIESTLQGIKTRDAAYHDLVSRFGSLFTAKEQVRTALMAANPPSPPLDGDRLAAGHPVLAGEDLTPWADAFKQSAHSLLPVLAQVLRLEPEASRGLTAYLDKAENLPGLAQARIEGNRKHFETTSVQLGIAPRTLLPYISEAVSAPVLCAIASRLGESLSSLSWGYGHCPVCGSSPSISQLAPKDADNSEYLVGGGGKKYLHCSLCGHDWHYKRNACAACGNEDSESRELLYTDGAKHERVEVCHQCGKYMLNVDMREYASLPHLDTIQMGLIHLDILAHKRHLNPVSPTLWNTLTEAAA